MTNDFIKGALWSIKQIRKYLPFSPGYRCDCSADCVYYLDIILDKLEKKRRKINKVKNERFTKS